MFIVWGIYYGVKGFDEHFFFLQMIQYIPSTQKILKNDLPVNVTSLQYKPGVHEAGTVGHHYLFFIYKPLDAAMETLFTGYYFL